ncbi:MAG: helix-turn-helix transcriptional regulator [Victivallales bacterium]|nr:helix-turn-helix transcriptional regulator [Victivallales bacterium]
MNLSFFDGLEFALGAETVPRTSSWRNQPIYYGIQYSHEEPMRLRIDGREFGLLRGPHAFLTIPGHIYEYGPQKGAWYHHAFICTFGPRTAHYRETGLMADELATAPVKIMDGHRFLATLRSLFQYVNIPVPPPPRAVLLLEDLLLQMHESLDLAQGVRHDRSSTIAYLEARMLSHPERQFNFNAEAARLGVTLTHFRRVFRETYGIPPRQFLIRCRLQRAAELLTTTTRSVKEIADLCGFANSDYFTRLFHQKFKHPPHIFRARHN